MNLEQLQQKLLAAARAHPPGDHVPYAFEKRILACLTAKSAPDHWALWARALWRAAAPCVALTLLFGVWAWVSPNGGSGTDSEEFSQHFEQTMLAAVENDAEEVW